MNIANKSKYPLNWDLSFFYDSIEDPRITKDMAIITQKVEEFAKKYHNDKKHLEDPNALLLALKEYENLMLSFGNEGRFIFYSSLCQSLNQNDPKIKALNNKVSELNTELTNKYRFFMLEISKIPADNQKKFLEAEVLSEYKHFLEKAFEEAKYLLSEKEENILSTVSKGAYSNWVQMIESFLSKESATIVNENREKQNVNFHELFGFLSSQNKTTRDSAAKGIAKILKKHVEVAENEINSILEFKKNTDKLRGFSRPDQSSLISNDLDSDVVDAMLNSVVSRYDISQKFYKLKASLMGVEKIDYHERTIPILSTHNKEYTYDESVDLVSTVFKNLDPLFYEIFTDMLEKRRFDVFPKEGKSGGAFCTNNLKNLPIYVLLNHKNKRNDVTTIAHEMGHAINHTLVAKNENELNNTISLATAETASTFMEDFVLEEILRTTGEKERLSIYLDILSDNINTITRQVACYKFEQDLHKNFRKKGYLSAKDINKLFKKNMKAYMGNYVKQNYKSELWWVYWSHIRYFFYVFSYASGLLISKSLQSKYREDKEFMKEIKKFLSTGGSKSPKEIFAEMGIDITNKEFW
ncbi:MAG: M3 family oligoendopeptidase, partial [Thermosphaera sp.]